MILSAVAVTVARLAQFISMTWQDHQGRLQLYVDDPLLAVKGAKRQRRRAVVKFMVILSALGFPLAIAKAMYSKSLTWIGIRL